MKIKLNKDQAMVLDVVQRAVEDKKCSATINMNDGGFILSLISLSLGEIGSIEFDLCVHNSESIISWINDLYRTTITIVNECAFKELDVGDHIVELDADIVSVDKSGKYVIIHNNLLNKFESVTFEQLKDMNASSIDDARYIDINL